MFFIIYYFKEEYKKEIDELKQLSSSTESIQKEYDEYKKNAEIKLTEYSQIEAELRKKIDFLEKTIAKFSEELESKRNCKDEIDNEKLQNEIKTLNDKLKNEIQNKDNEINDLIKQLDDAKNGNINNKDDDAELISGLKDQIEQVKKEKTQANEKIKQLEEQIENTEKNKQSRGNKNENDIIAKYEDQISKLNKEYASLKVSTLNELFEKDSQINKYKNLILSISKKYKVQFNI